MTNRRLSLAVLLGFLLVACSQAPSAPPKPTVTPSSGFFPSVTPVPSATPSPAPPKGPDFGLPDGSAGSSAGPTLPSGERMIVRQGSMVMVVEDLAQALEKAAETARTLDGYVIYSSQQGEEGASTAIRVPSEKFDVAMAALRGLAIRMVKEDIRGQDVTEEYVDLEASLRNLEAAESQYLELLRRADKVEDALKVQQEMVNVRGQIERIKGRMNLLERTTDMSEIDASFQPSRSPEPLVRPEWNAGETLRGALRSLSSFGQGLAGAGIWLLVYSPLWIVLGLIAFFLWRRFSR